MRRFTVDWWNLDIRLPCPSEQYLYQVILENNDTARIWEDVMGDNPFILECENKPRDLPLYGWKWKEIK